MSAPHTAGECPPGARAMAPHLHHSDGSRQNGVRSSQLTTKAISQFLKLCCYGLLTFHCPHPFGSQRNRFSQQ